MNARTWPRSCLAYWSLTKPGIVLGNAMTALGGFFFATKGAIDDGRLLIAMLLGLSSVIASGCVYNNYSDREADRKMVRTQGRALVQGLIALPNTLCFAGVLAIGGFFLLQYTNTLTSLLAFVGFFNYVILYGLSKYRTTYATLIGSISGAIPPVVGYTAVTELLDWGAYLLFSILVLWQMPHFYAIAIYRLEEYRSASIPVLPVVIGIQRTKIHMVVYLFAFVFASLVPSFLGYTGHLYLVAMGVLGLSWLALGIRSLCSQDDRKSAREIFLFSLIVITVFSVLISKKIN